MELPFGKFGCLLALIIFIAPNSEGLDLGLDGFRSCTFHLYGFTYSRKDTFDSIASGNQGTQLWTIYNQNTYSKSSSIAYSSRLMIDVYEKCHVHILINFRQFSWVKWSPSLSVILRGQSYETTLSLYIGYWLDLPMSQDGRIFYYSLDWETGTVIEERYIICTVYPDFSWDRSNIEIQILPKDKISDLHILQKQLKVQSSLYRKYVQVESQGDENFGTYPECLDPFKAIQLKPRNYLGCSAKLTIVEILGHIYNFTAIYDDPFGYYEKFIPTESKIGGPGNWGLLNDTQLDLLEMDKITTRLVYCTQVSKYQIWDKKWSQPADQWTWVALAGSLLISILVLYLVGTANITTNGVSANFKLLDFISFFITNFCMFLSQGVSKMITNYQIVISISTIVLVNGYLAFFSSEAIITTALPEFRDLQEFLENGYQILIYSYTDSDYNSTLNHMYRPHFKKMKPHFFQNAFYRVNYPFDDPVTRSYLKEERMDGKRTNWTGPIGYPHTEPILNLMSQPDLKLGMVMYDDYKLLLEIANFNYSHMSCSTIREPFPAMQKRWYFVGMLQSKFRQTVDKLLSSGIDKVIDKFHEVVKTYRSEKYIQRRTYHEREPVAIPLNDSFIQSCFWIWFSILGTTVLVFVLENHSFVFSIIRIIWNGFLYCIKNVKELVTQRLKYN